MSALVQLGPRGKARTPPGPGAGAFLPVSLEEARRRGWEQLDVVLINGDAYVDHPTFGVPLMGRLLASDRARARKAVDYLGKAQAGRDRLNPAMTHDLDLLLHKVSGN